MKGAPIQVNHLVASDASGDPTMSSRDIADLTGKRHDNVMVDIRKMLIELHGEGGLLRFQDTLQNEQNGQSYTIFRLPKRETLILVSGYSVSLRAKIIDRWDELESQKRLDPAKLSRMDLLQLAMAAESEAQAEREQRLRLEAKVEEDAPKVAALELISASSGSVTITEASKILSKKRADLTAWMHANGWIYRQNGSWVAYKPQIDNRRLEYKEANYTDQTTGMACRKSYCHITPKGLAKLATVFGVSLGQAA